MPFKTGLPYQSPTSFSWLQCFLKIIIKISTTTTTAVLTDALKIQLVQRNLTKLPMNSVHNLQRDKQNHSFNLMFRTLHIHHEGEGG